MALYSTLFIHVQVLLDYWGGWLMPESNNWNGGFLYLPCLCRPVVADLGDAFFYTDKLILKHSSTQQNSKSNSFEEGMLTCFAISRKATIHCRVTWDSVQAYQRSTALCIRKTKVRMLLNLPQRPVCKYRRRIIFLERQIRLLKNVTPLNLLDVATVGPFLKERWFKPETKIFSCSKNK